MHPRRPRGSQSGREKRRDESFQVQAIEPLGTDSHRTISKNSSGCRLLIGHKKMLCIIVPNRRTVSPGFFSCVSYTTAIVSITACLGYAPKKMHAVRKLWVWYKSPSDFKILSGRKLKTLFQKYKLQLTTGIHACIGHVLRKYIYREFLKDTTTETSQGKVNSYFFFSLYRDYSNSLTLSNASELFWSWISINHIQVHEENEFCHCLFTSFTKREIRRFHG